MDKPILTVLTGAGISQESGIDTFRAQNGLWANHDVEEVGTLSGFMRNPEKVMEFFNQRRKEALAAAPNSAHKILAELEQWFDVRILTQNIDELHERAGSTNVTHMHGKIWEDCSIENRNIISENRGDITIGQLMKDGKQARPNVVLFDEMVQNFMLATSHAAHAKIFLVVGTSLQVFPVASLAGFAHGADAWIIDPAPSVDPRYFSVIPLKACAGMEIFKQEMVKKYVEN